MSQASPTRVEQRPADIKSLHRQLEEMAARSRRASQPGRDVQGRPEGTVLVIRGK
jgi:hypothetical protein